MSGGNTAPVEQSSDNSQIQAELDAMRRKNAELLDEYKKAVAKAKAVPDGVDIQELLDFKEKLDNILKCCFSNNEKFITSLKVNFSLQNMNRIIDYFPSGRFREFHKSETKQAGRNDCQVCRFKVASWQQRSK